MKYTGVMDFNLITFLMNSMFGTVTPDLLDNGYTWFWNPSATDPLTPATFTIEQGSVKGAERMPYSLVSDMTFKWSKEEASLDGTMFGQIQERNATLTANIQVVLTDDAATSATTLTVAALSGGIADETVLEFTSGKIAVVNGAVIGGATSITVDALVAGLSTGEMAFTIPEMKALAVNPKSIGTYISLDGASWTELNDTLDGEFTLSGLWAPSFHNTETSETFDRVVELQPNFTGSITVEEGSEADNFMQYLEDGTQIFIGFKMTGPQINASPLVKHLFKMYLPVYVTKPAPGDKGGVYGNTFSFDIAHLLNFGILQATLINKLAGM
jgi:hypothetical protein